MADPRPEETSRTAGTPVWLKAIGIVVLVAVVLFVVVTVLAGGGHTPPPGAH